MRKLFVAYWYFDVLDGAKEFAGEFISNDKLAELEVTAITDPEDLFLIEEMLGEYSNVRDARILYWKWIE